MRPGRTSSRRILAGATLTQHELTRTLMALTIAAGAPTVFIRRAAYEASGLTRSVLDERLALTADEFRVEANLVVVGPIYSDSDRVSELIAELERLGLV